MWAKGTRLVCASKGIETETLSFMGDVAAQALPQAHFVALSGPSFAEEVPGGSSDGDRRGVTRRSASATDVQQLFSTTTFRVYTSDDVVGVTLGGSLKNTIAIAAGIVEGLGLGNNPRAALLTRGLAEMARLGAALGANAATFSGLAGMGDLILTCTGALSRNRQLGIALASGITLEEYQATHRTVIEGVNTALAASRLAKRHGVEMPITDQVAAILFDNVSPRDSIQLLMERTLKGGAVAMTSACRHPVQQFFSIGEVCSLTELKPHVLRYWESQFRFLSPAKNRSGNRVYKAREVELIMLVKHLLYTEKFTIEGARIRLDQYRKSGDLKTTGKQAMRYETVGDVRRALDDVLAVLDGREPTMRLPAEEQVAVPVAVRRRSCGGSCAGSDGQDRSDAGAR